VLRFSLNLYRVLRVRPTLTGGFRGTLAALLRVLGGAEGRVHRTTVAADSRLAGFLATPMASAAAGGVIVWRHFEDLVVCRAVTTFINCRPTYSV
jgi:hypothetical protein